MEQLYRAPAEQMTALEILRQLERLEKQVAQLTVENGRWRSLAITAMRAWDDKDDGWMQSLGKVMDQIAAESRR